MDTSLFLVLTLVPTFAIGGALGATIAYLYAKASLSTPVRRHRRRTNVWAGGAPSRAGTGRFPRRALFSALAGTPDDSMVALLGIRAQAISVETARADLGQALAWQEASGRERPRGATRRAERRGDRPGTGSRGSLFG